MAGTNNVAFNLNGGGSAYVGGANSGALSLSNGTGSLNVIGANLNLNGGATGTKVSSLSLIAPTSTLGSFASTFQTQLTALSTQLNGVAANSAATSSNGANAFNAAPDAGGTAVFDVNRSRFAANSMVTSTLVARPR